MINETSTSGDTISPSRRIILPKKTFLRNVGDSKRRKS